MSGGPLYQRLVDFANEMLVPEDADPDIRVLRLAFKRHLWKIAKAIERNDSGDEAQLIRDCVSRQEIVDAALARLGAAQDEAEEAGNERGDCRDVPTVEKFRQLDEAMREARAARERLCKR